MNRKVSVTPRWYGSVPTREGRPLPRNRWTRAGRKRKWIVRWYAPDGSRPQQTFDMKDAADEFAETKVVEFGTRGPQARAKPRATTVGEFVDEVLTLRIGAKGRRLTIGALRECRTILRRFAEFVGAHRQLDSIAQVDMTRYVAALRDVPSTRGKPLSESSVRKHQATLKASFTVAVKQLGYLQHNPFESVKNEAVSETPIRYVTPSEFHGIVEACRSMSAALWWETFITIGYTAGTRLNEAAHLTWSDVDFEANTLRIIAKPEISGVAAWQPKDLDSRTIPLPTVTMDLLGRMHAVADDGAEFVFLSSARVAWIRAKREAGEWAEGQSVLNNVWKNFKRRAAHAGVTDVTVHDLRRSAITHWARKLAASVVKELAGHSDIATTLRYYVNIGEAALAEARDVPARALLLDAKVTQS